MEQITLNLIPGGIPQICNVSQYDDGRVIRLHLKNGSSDYTLSGTETISLFVSKRDRTTYVCDVTNTSSSYVDITTVPEMCDVSGESECELTISSGNTVLGTGNFRMIVDPDAFDGDLKVKSVSGPITTFETDLAEDLIKLDVDLEPIQDLHGYDNPWPAGGGKNIACLSADTLDNSQRIVINYLDENNINFTIDGTYARCMYKVKAKAGSTVTVSFKAQGIEGAYNRVNFNPENSYSNYQPWGSYNVNSYDTLATYTKTFTLDVDDFYVGFYWTTGTDTGAPIVRDFQVEVGSTATSFVPYSNICPIEGHVEAKIVHTGKNRCSMSDTTFVQYQEVEINEIPAGSYVYSAVITSTDTDSDKCAIIFLDENKNTLMSRSIDRSVGNVRVSTSFSVSAPIKFLRLYAASGFPSGAGDTASFVDNMICLQSESNPTDYEPYTGTEVTVQFGQTVYKGKLYSEQRKVLVTHVCETFDGSSDERWVTTSSSSVRYGFRIYFQNNKKPTARAIDEMLSSTIPLCTTSEAASVDDDIITCRSTTYLHKIFYIFAPPSKISTIEELRAFLANEPETVMYPLDEPFFIDLTQVQTADIEAAPVVSFETTLARPLETSEHYFSCSQAEGTPTPDNPIPIAGVTSLTAARMGKNLCPIFTGYSGNGLTTTVNPDGTIHVTGTATGSGGFITDSNMLGCAIPSNYQITISISNTIPGRLRQFLAGVGRDSSSDINAGEKSTTFSRDFKIVSIRLYLFTTAGQSYDFSFKFQIELGSTATPYEPYSGESITVSLGGTYYGGKLVQSEDGSRKIVLDKAFTKISALTWSYVPSFTYFNALPTNIKVNSDAGKKLDGLMCDIYTNRTPSQAGSGDIDLSIAAYQTAMRIKHKAYTDVNSFVAAVGDHDIVYPLETPIEINLPDGDPLTTLAGENNVYCNTGNTALTYYYNMVADPIRIPALVGTNNVYSDAGDVDVEYYTTLDDGGDGE